MDANWRINPPLPIHSLIEPLFVKQIRNGVTLYERLDNPDFEVNWFEKSVEYAE